MSLDPIICQCSYGGLPQLRSMQHFKKENHAFPFNTLSKYQKVIKLMALNMYLLTFLPQVVVFYFYMSRLLIASILALSSLCCRQLHTRRAAPITETDREVQMESEVAQVPALLSKWKSASKEKGHVLWPHYYFPTIAWYRDCFHSLKQAVLIFSKC